MYCAKYELLQPREQSTAGPGCSQSAGGVDTRWLRRPSTWCAWGQADQGWRWRGPAHTACFCAQRGSPWFPCTGAKLVWLIPVPLLLSFGSRYRGCSCPGAEDGPVLRRGLASSCSKCTEARVFAARAGLSLQQDRSEQPCMETSQGRGTHHRVGLALWLLVPMSPGGSQAHPCPELPPAPWATLGVLQHLPRVVLGIQAWCPLPIAFPIPELAVVSFKTPDVFLWAACLGL